MFLVLYGLYGTVNMWTAWLCVLGMKDGCCRYEQWRELMISLRQACLAQARLAEARLGLLDELLLRRPIFILSERMSRSGEETSPQRESAEGHYSCLSSSRLG